MLKSNLSFSLDQHETIVTHYSIVGRHNQDEKQSGEKKFKIARDRREEKSITGEWPITITVVY